VEILVVLYLSPLNPDVPELPLVPDVPLVPELPEDPDVPELPEDPDVPELPEEPLDPELPLVPEEPDVPLDPEVPEDPDSPEVPDVPSNPLTTYDIEYKFPSVSVNPLIIDVAVNANSVVKSKASSTVKITVEEVLPISVICNVGAYPLSVKI
jgi:hypothetical protein